LRYLPGICGRRTCPARRDVRIPGGLFPEEQLPAFLAEAVDALGSRFDPLIVDEAQDLDEERGRLARAAA
jgi:hypothetical protein